MLAEPCLYLLFAHLDILEGLLVLRLNVNDDLENIEFHLLFTQAKQVFQTKDLALFVSPITNRIVLELVIVSILHEVDLLLSAEREIVSAHLLAVASFGVELEQRHVQYQDILGHHLVTVRILKHVTVQKLH